MILSDKAIGLLLQSGRLSIDPLDDPDMQIQPASVDLRLGSTFLTFSDVNPGDLDLQSAKPRMDTTSSPSFAIMPGQFVLGVTKERVHLPDDLVARVEGRSSLGRLGLLVHATAGFIDPGFDGNITLEFYNLNTRPIIMHADMRICQLSLHQMTGPASRPYGHPSRGSKYQGSGDAVASRIGDDAGSKKPVRCPHGYMWKRCQLCWVGSFAG